MKVRVFGFLLALAVAPLGLPAGSAGADNNVGCGLGTQLWEGKDDLVIQVLAATTNFATGSQTFGVSSETLGCRANQKITVEYRVNLFAGANLDRLAREMAQGEGEALASLAHLMQIDQSDRAAFYRLTKENFAAIFASDEVTAGEMLAAIDRLMAEDSQLARYARS